MFLDRFRGFLGIIVILGLAYLLSENRKADLQRVLFWGLTLQWGFAVIVLQVPAGKLVLEKLGKFVEAILGCAMSGAHFLFGEKLVDEISPFAFRRLADGDLRGGVVCRALPLGRDAVDRPRFRVGDGTADGGEWRGIARRRRLALPGPDRGAADDPSLSADAHTIRSCSRS